MYISAGRTILSDGAEMSSILAINRRTASSAILFIGRSTEVIAGDTRAAILVPDIHAIDMVSGMAMPLFSKTFFAPTACRSEKQKSASGISWGGAAIQIVFHCFSSVFLCSSCFHNEFRSIVDMMFV